MSRNKTHDSASRITKQPGPQAKSGGMYLVPRSAQPGKVFCHLTPHHPWVQGSPPMTDHYGRSRCPSEVPTWRTPCPAGSRSFLQSGGQWAGIERKLMGPWFVIEYCTSALSASADCLTLSYPHSKRIEI